MEEIKIEYPEWIGVSKAKDLTNQTFGELKVLYRYYLNSSAQKAKWVCRCSCGNIIVVLSNSLCSGKTISCGHIHRDQLTNRNKIPLNDILDTRYGLLTPIKELEALHRNNRNYRVFLCQCDCGGTKEVIFEQLQAGDVSSCGCITSKGEEKIVQFLKELAISYKRQVSFNDLKNINLLKFDISFYSKNNKLILIEYQGRQHYDIKSKFYSEEGIYRDELKKQYCTKNNIPLLIFNSSHSDSVIVNQIKEAYNDL